MFYRTITPNIGWEYTNNPDLATNWQNARYGYFADVEEVPDTLAHAIAEAMDTAEQLGYFLYPAGSVKGIGMRICAEALFLAKSENDIAKVMSAYRHAKPQNSVYKMGHSYYVNCQLAQHVIRPVTGHDFAAWVKNF